MSPEHQIDLFGMAQTASREARLAIRKRELRNLLTSYADEADVFAETIQNAFDAILTARNRRLYGDTSGPRLDIVIGRRSGDPHYLLVCDNGVGMPPEIATRFTTPGFTHDKALGRTIGYKGVGASFFFAASNNVAFRSEDADGNRTAATVRASYRWIMSNNEPPPEVQREFNCPEKARQVLPSSRGTVVYYEFHDGLKPKSLSHIVKYHEDPYRELRRWASYLCAKTALGQVDTGHQCTAGVGLHLDRGEKLYSTEWTLGEFDLDNNQLGYPYPWKVLKVHKDVDEIDSTPVAKQFIRHKGKHQALRLHWSKDQLLVGLENQLSEDEEELATEHLIFLDVFFAYSTAILTEVHERTGSRANVLRYGIRMACDGIPQGRVMDFDLTRHQGLARQAHALVAFSGLELDTGRKIPVDEVVRSLVRKVSTRAMGHLVDYRWALKKKDRPDPSPDLEGWRIKTRDRMSLSLVPILFRKLGHGAPIGVDPDTEQDVIALFAALLAQGVLRGYEIVALSGFNQYDGLVNIVTDTSEVRDEVDPLSIRSHEQLRGGDYRVLEFKLQFESLLEDFDLKKKRPQDIDLLVCWTLPDMNVRRGLLEYTYGDRNDFRETYGMTHLWVDEGETSSIPILCLRHFVSEKLKVLEMAAGNPGRGSAAISDLEDREKLASI